MYSHPIPSSLLSSLLTISYLSTSFLSICLSYFCPHSLLLFLVVGFLLPLKYVHSIVHHLLLPGGLLQLTCLHAVKQKLHSAANHEKHLPTLHVPFRAAHKVNRLKLAMAYDKVTHYRNHFKGPLLCKIHFHFRLCGSIVYVGTYIFTCHAV